MEHPLNFKYTPRFSTCTQDFIYNLKGYSLILEKNTLVVPRFVETYLTNYTFDFGVKISLFIHIEDILVLALALICCSKEVLLRDFYQKTVTKDCKKQWTRLHAKFEFSCFFSKNPPTGSYVQATSAGICVTLSGPEGCKKVLLSPLDSLKIGIVLLNKYFFEKKEKGELSRHEELRIKAILYDKS